VLPANTLEAAEMLAECINAAPEETMRDALEIVKAEVVSA
jgi:hypothetical protein